MPSQPSPPSSSWKRPNVWTANEPALHDQPATPSSSLLTVIAIDGGGKRATGFLHAGVRQRRGWLRGTSPRADRGSRPEPTCCGRGARSSGKPEARPGAPRLPRLKWNAAPPRAHLCCAATCLAVRGRSRSGNNFEPRPLCFYIGQIAYLIGMRQGSDQGSRSTFMYTPVRR